MYNCIFTPHCTELNCDRSCPALVETSYLLERNGISMNSFVFTDQSINFGKVQKILRGIENNVGAYIADGKRTTVQLAEIFTYCAICLNWHGNRLHCNVYNLKYSKYLDELKKSWNSKAESDELEYMRIWIASSKVLIISNFDYVSFGEFESQTLLNIIQQRQVDGKSTLLITPPVNQLVGGKFNQFLEPMRQRIRVASDVVQEVIRR